MESPSKHQKLIKITPRLVLQVALPILLLLIIPLQLLKNTSFITSSSKPTPPPTTTTTTTTSTIHDQVAPSRHKPLPSITRPKCDLFTGEWVPNPDAPYYTNTSCWAIHEHQNCMKYGRPDSEFMKWRWKPDECELPLFNPRQFFEIVKGKSLAFVGDSVARNQLQSMICLLSRVEWPYDVSYTQDEYFKRWHYRSYDFTMAIFTSPFLVKAQENDPGGPTGTGLFGLHLDQADEAWKANIDEFDYLVISAGHWFFRPLMFYEHNKVIGCRYCQIENITDYPITFGYRKVFRTAFRAILERENFKGIVYLRTFAPSHFEGGEWNEGGDCKRQRPFKSSESTLQGVDLDLYMAQVGEFYAAQKLARRRGRRFRLIDMTQPMLLRPDGHPSRYGHWPNENVVLYNDCVHWCLPGPIDSWSDFLLEMMRNEGVFSKQEKILLSKDRRFKS
ncbi:hypothetical protein Cgig2_015538 [Carnegiea gigantea]|uniref:Trichome birefringence-like N-terminal domain-containing protein n=1 Tax=Carnegiea gigantea TaxID=171969 RepID=A0A9Q1GPE7_9CARY|nr:hypothetical protein Cgig2_015538 [Carnegiea gigantea]